MNMLPVILAIIGTGICGGLIHTILFGKGFYMPKVTRDHIGKKVELGFLEDVIVGIVAAFIVAIPSMAYLPVLNLIGACILPAIAGKEFLNAAVNQYIEHKKAQLERELDEIERKEKEENKKAK